MVVNPLLQCTGLVMRFGGVVALKSVDISVGKHEVVGLVGPNGSGKTTFFNVVTGIYKPTAGKVVFEDHDITGKKPQEIFAAGISRTFQRSRLVLPLSVFDNVMVGASTHLRFGFWHNILARKSFTAEVKRWEDEVGTLLRALNPELPSKIHRPVAELSMIDRRRVEICRALVGKPRLLLLDEPSAGMTPDETQQLMDEILKMDMGVQKPSIVLIEHEMNVIRRVSDRVIVLNFGEKLCEGSYAAVTAHPQVQEAYLGKEVTEDGDD